MTVKGWIDRSKVDTRLGYKILIAGLAEAGKTAVKRQFFLKHKTEDVEGLSATLSYERLSVIVNKTPITILDLGGQKIFLKRFLTTFSPFIFSSVVALVFLIDVSNRTARNNAIQYFKSCIEKINKYSQETKIFVFLHKNDLVENWPNYETIHDLLKEEFQVDCKKQILFFRTTIFNPGSIVKSFGRIIELSMPELSRSELVEGEIIGEIEEYSSGEIALIKPSAKIRREEKVLEEPKRDEDLDPAYLERIQNLMKGSMVDESVKPLTSQSTLAEAITEEMQNESELIHIDFPRVQTSIQMEDGSDDISENKAEDIETNLEISSLIDYYGINAELASEVVNSGYKSLFQMAATAGVPLNLVSDVITKYIPFLKSKGLDLKNLPLERLLDLFSSYLRMEVSQDNLFSCLVFASERPNLSIDQIIRKYLKKGERKPKKLVEPTKVKATLFAQPEPPSESVEGIIPLPDTKGIGFKANLTKRLVHLTLYCENRIVNRAKLSPTITVKELVYLLSFQINLASMGLIEGGNRSIALSARIIHEAVSQMRDGNLKSTSKIKIIYITNIIELN
jgi:signal recognition particle receptor subunit beta